VIVRYLYFVGVAIAPDETNAPLVVDADAVLTLAVSAQRL
jgi:hypothetical protein